MRLAADRLPERELVAVIVAIVEKSALLHDETTRVHARSVPAVPSQGALSGHLRNRGDRLADVLALVRLGELVMLHPAPAMRADVEACPADRRRGRRIALQRETAAEYGQRQAALLEQPQQPPEADAAAVFEHAVGGEIAAF